MSFGLPVCFEGLPRGLWALGAVTGGLLVLAAPFQPARCKCAHSDPYEFLRQRYEMKLSALNVGDGVDAREAEAIAELYTHEYISNCGGPTAPVLRDGGWRVQVLLGFAGTPSPRFMEIGAKTGGVSWPGGPAFRTLEAFGADLVGGIAKRRPYDVP